MYIYLKKSQPATRLICQHSPEGWGLCFCSLSPGKHPPQQIYSFWQWKMGPRVSGDVCKTVLWQSCQESDKEGITGWQILTERYHRSPFQPGRGWISPRVGEAYLLWKGLQWPIHSQTGLVAADHVWLGSSKTGLTTLTQVVVAPLVDGGGKLGIHKDTFNHVVLIASWLSEVHRKLSEVVPKMTLLPYLKTELSVAQIQACVARLLSLKAADNKLLSKLICLW